MMSIDITSAPTDENDTHLHQGTLLTTKLRRTNPGVLAGLSSGGVQSTLITNVANEAVRANPFGFKVRSVQRKRSMRQSIVLSRLVSTPLCQVHDQGLLAVNLYFYSWAVRLIEMAGMQYRRENNDVTVLFVPHASILE